MNSLHAKQCLKLSSETSYEYKKSSLAYKKYYKTKVVCAKRMIWQEYLNVYIEYGCSVWNLYINFLQLANL